MFLPILAPVIGNPCKPVGFNLEGGVAWVKNLSESTTFE
jgi:hypothetical protein